MKVVKTNPSSNKGDQMPVESVSWNDARAYCTAVDMRLPTEAEYEFASRGGSAAARYAPADGIAWFITNSNGKPHEVAQKQANPYGLYDMLGDVWEWAADWYGPYDAAAATDPKGPATGDFRVVRGNAWNFAESYVRASNRFRYVPDSRDQRALVSFRCAGN